MNEQTSAIKKETLANRLTVITETMPQVRTVAVGIWVKAGSRVEPAPLNGISHFIEHMVFKGTEHRSASDIAREGDALGGHLDAFTSKEYVCFNAKVLDEHLPRALDVLTDMMLAPLFRDDDIEKERSVVLEEIKMDEDNPEYLVHELFARNFWPGHAMGRPILGSKETLATFGHGTLKDFFRGWYVPQQMIVAAAGRLEHERFVELVSRYLLPLQGKPNGHRDSPPQVEAAISTRTKRELEQVHLCVGAPCYPLPHQERYALALLNNILGGGMASRLFQNIREREGLAYSVFSDAQAYRDTGALVVYAGTSQDTAEKTLQLVLKEFERLKREPVAAEELQRARDNFKASLMFSMESTGARMSHLARQEIYFGRFFGFDELLAAIDAVTPERIQSAAREFFQPEKVAVSAVGRLDGFKVSRADLSC